MTGKWKIERYVSENGENSVRLLEGKVLRMLMPAGCLQMGWEGGDLPRFLRTLNAHGAMLKALEKIAGLKVPYTEKHPPYGEGLTNAHRVCASIANAAIAKGKP